MEPERPVWELLFLSTPSARRATGFFPRTSRAYSISIHALRKEGDPSETSPP